MASTEFRNFFVPAPRRPPNTEVLCDFGSFPWYRIAWLITRKERRRDLNLFYGLANISATVPECDGKQPAIRQWYSLIDSKSRSLIQNFHVCTSCVKSIEVLLPPIRGLFVKCDPRRSVTDPRICNLRFDSNRFIKYFDALETTADSCVPSSNGTLIPPDTRALTSLCKNLASIPECVRDQDLYNAHWNIITQLPEFTVCEECFEEVVWPEWEDGKAIPRMFGKKLVFREKASCQLYSRKMRGIFRLAVDGDDWGFLASEVRKRRELEARYKREVDAVKRFGGHPSVVAKEIERLEREWKCLE